MNPIIFSSYIKMQFMIENDPSNNYKQKIYDWNIYTSPDQIANNTIIFYLIYIHKEQDDFHFLRVHDVAHMNIHPGYDRNHKMEELFPSF